jgi:FMN phosphatase YigB (HAD superfamily)
VNYVTHYRLFSLENLVTLTLLVDLDNTLLGNNMETFIPAYLKALGEHLSDHISPEKMVSAMLSATQQMMDNTSIHATLKEAFDPDFYPPLRLVEPEIREYIDRFYQEKFPNLKILTQFRSEAADFISSAVRRGYHIGIATNPLFPRTAITQRLAWAGLPQEEFPFTLIPSYETFHFAKPNPAYFAEFLGILGWPEGQVLMVGNDPDHDIRGAQEMGIPAYWVSNRADQYPTDQPEPDGVGSLGEVLPWIDSLPSQTLEPDYNIPTAMIATLRGSPAALNTTLSKIPTEAWPWRPAQKAWGLTEIICHLRDVEAEINLPRLRKILQVDNPFIPGVDSDSWADQRDYLRQDGEAAFEDFLDAREETLDILDNLNEAGWSRPIRHAIFGPTHLREMVRIMAGHERLHGRQIHEVILKQQTRV